MTIDTTYLDSGADKIKLARPAIFAIAQKLNAIEGMDGALWEPALAQKKLNYVEIDALFTGGSGAVQGVAYATVSGVEKVYFTVVTAGTTYATTERVRIVEATLTNDGTQIVNGSLVYSGELNLGHGQDLTAEVVGAQVYLWTCSPTTVADTGAGKGVSRVTWNDAATSVITTYLLCGATGSGHRREHLYQGNPCLSDDGQYLVYIGDYANSGGNREVLVFDRASVVAAGDSLTVDPVSSFKLQAPSHDDGDILQGACCDGKFIYTMAGYYNAFHWHVIQKYDLVGNLVREIPITTEREEYGLTNLLSHGTLGNPYRMEPEGISIRNGEIIVGMIDVWRSGASVVSYAGSNWAYIGTGATVSPNNMRYWVRTTATAGGAYNSGSSYSIGGTVTRSRKSFWSIKESTGAVGELPISPMDFCKQPGSKWSPITGITYSFRYGEALSFPAFSEQTGAFTNTFSYLNGTFSLYDSRVGSDNTKSLDIVVDTDSAIVESTIKGKGNLFCRGNNDLTDGAGFNAYSTADTNAGQMRIYAVDPTGPTLRTMIFRPVSPAFYPASDNAYSLGIGSLRWSNVYTALANFKEYTVSTLPSAAGLRGTQAFVTDATATTFASVPAGGGGNAVPVFSDGTNWRIG